MKSREELMEQKKEKQKNENSCFLLFEIFIPNEIFEYIFEILEGKDLLHTMLGCKSWYFLITASNFWRYWWESNFPDVYPPFEISIEDPNEETKNHSICSNWHETYSLAFTENIIKFQTFQKSLTRSYEPTWMKNLVEAFYRGDISYIKKDFEKYETNFSDKPGFFGKRFMRRLLDLEWGSYPTTYNLLLMLPGFKRNKDLQKWLFDYVIKRDNSNEKSRFVLFLEKCGLTLFKWSVLCGQLEEVKKEIDIGHWDYEAEIKKILDFNIKNLEKIARCRRLNKSTVVCEDDSFSLAMWVEQIEIFQWLLKSIPKDLVNQHAEKMRYYLLYSVLMPKSEWTELRGERLVEIIELIEHYIPSEESIFNLSFINEPYSKVSPNILSLATRYNELLLIKWLLDKGADIHLECAANSKTSHAEWHENKTLIEYAFAEEEVDIRVVKYLLKQGAQVKNLSGVQLHEIFTQIILHGTRQKLSLLLSMIDINAKHENTGWTFIMNASSQLCSPAVKLLLKKGAKVNRITKSGYSALHAGIAGVEDYSTFRGNEKKVLEIVKLLVEDGNAIVDISKEGGTKGTPLFLAQKEKLKEVVNYLMDHGANAANIFLPKRAPRDSLLVVEQLKELEKEREIKSGIEKRTFNSIVEKKRLLQEKLYDEEERIRELEKELEESRRNAQNLRKKIKSREKREKNLLVNNLVSTPFWESSQKNNKRKSDKITKDDEENSDEDELDSNKRQKFKENSV